MRKVLTAIVAMMLLTVGMVSAYTPAWSVDKAVVVTGDYEWSGSAWTLPNPAPITATYGFQAYGDGMSVSYMESETLGQAWKYDFDNMLSTDDVGAVHSFADIFTVNDPRTTPGTDFTAYAFGTMNTGEYTQSTVVVSGNGFATIDHSASFDSAFTSQNFVCVNDCE